MEHPLVHTQHAKMSGMSEGRILSNSLRPNGAVVDRKEQLGPIRLNVAKIQISLLSTRHREAFGFSEWRPSLSGEAVKRLSHGCFHRQC